MSCWRQNEITLLWKMLPQYHLPNFIDNLQQFSLGLSLGCTSILVVWTSHLRKCLCYQLPNFIDDLQQFGLGLSLGCTSCELWTSHLRKCLWFFVFLSSISWILKHIIFFIFLLLKYSECLNSFLVETMLVMLRESVGFNSINDLNPLQLMAEFWGAIFRELKFSVVCWIQYYYDGMMITG